MKDLRVIVRVKNNLLLKRREELGITQREMARIAEVPVQFYISMENLTGSPVSVKGKWHPQATRLAQFWDCTEEELFPDAVRKIRNNRIEREIDAHLLLETVNDSTKQLSAPQEEQLEKAQLKEMIKAVLPTLTEREQIVLKKRFGLDDGVELTLEELSVSLNISRERLRQIEAKALRKLRHPSRAKLLISFIRDSEPSFGLWEDGPLSD